jgi:hypothetical protein
MALKARRAAPGQTFSFTDGAGRTRELVADADGRITPKSRDEEKILDVFGLPVAGPAAKKKASEAPKKVDEPGG